MEEGCRPGQIKAGARPGLKFDGMGRNVLRPYDREYEAGKIHERKRTDSRWNILMAMKRAAAAYTQFEVKISAIRFQ